MIQKFPRAQKNFKAKLFRGFLLALLPILAALALSDYGRIEKTAAAKTSGRSLSTDNPWRTIDEKAITSRAEQIGRPRAYRTVQLDRDRFDQTRASALKEFTAAARKSETVLNLPLPDGTDEVFRIVDSPVMEPALAARFPDIKTYSAQSTTDATVTVLHLERWQLPTSRARNVTDSPWLQALRVQSLGSWFEAHNLKIELLTLVATLTLLLR